MKKNLLVLAIVAGMSVNGRAQVTVDTRAYQPFTFREIISPYLMYKQAFEQAEDKMMFYFEKADDAIKKGRYSLAITYLKRCSELNKRFRGNLCNQKDIDNVIKFCEEEIRKQQQQTTKQGN